MDGKAFILLVVWHYATMTMAAESSSNSDAIQQHSNNLNSLSGQSLYTLFRNGFQGMQNSCKAHKYNHKIEDPECLPMTIPNKYCGGICASYFVPVKNSISNDVNGVFEDCRQCEPSSYQIVRVVLFCPKTNAGYKLKKIYLVNGCHCRGVKCILKKR